MRFSWEEDMQGWGRNSDRRGLGSVTVTMVQVSCLLATQTFGRSSPRPSSTIRVDLPRCLLLASNALLRIFGLCECPLVALSTTRGPLRVRVCAPV